MSSFMSFLKGGFGRILERIAEDDRTLTVVDLSHKNVGDAEAKKIAEALLTDTTVTDLILRYNNISDEGAKALAEALENNATLTWLCLGENKIGKEGAKALAEGLQHNATLTKLSLWDNKIGKEGAKALAEGLQLNATLTELSMGGSLIGNEGATALAEALLYNATLTTLKLGGNKIDDGGAKIQQLIKINQVAPSPHEAYQRKVAKLGLRPSSQVSDQKRQSAQVSGKAHAGTGGGLARSAGQERSRARAEQERRDWELAEKIQREEEEAARAAHEDECHAKAVREAEKEARDAKERCVAEEACLAEEAKRAEEAHLAEEARLAEETKRAEEARLAEEARCTEESRLTQEAKLAEERRLEEEHRMEKRRLAEEEESANHAVMHPGLQLLNDVKELRDFLKDGNENKAKAKLEYCLTQDYPTPNIFELLPPDDIEELLLSHGQDFHSILRKQAEVLVEMVDSNVAKPKSVKTGEGIGRLASAPPVVMDHTVREPATNTPFGHTAEIKYLSWKLVRLLGSRNIALSGLYYGDMFTVEEQFLHLLYDREGERGMQGGFVMCGPGETDRAVAMRMIQRCKVPNIFLDVTTMPSVRFNSQSISAVSQDVVSAVERADGLFSELGYPEPITLFDESTEQGQGQGAPMGQIYINFVDLMESVDLATTDRWVHGEQEPEKYIRNKQNAVQLERMFQRIKDMEKKHRVTSILFEEGRGRAVHTDYTCIAVWLRQHFPSPRYQILLHAHGGTGAEQSASLDAVAAGADGVWAGFIPQAAQAGHNSYFLYLDNLILNGNKQVWPQFDLHTGVEVAKMLYSLNFNSVRYPDDCPIWGRNAQPRVHTAFDVTTEDGWRSRSAGVYHSWSAEEQVRLDKMRAELAEIEKKFEGQHPFDNYRQYRVAPLVTDAENIANRLGELKLVKREGMSVQGTMNLYGNLAQEIMISTMNAGIPVNYDTVAMLEKVAGWIERLLASKKGEFRGIDNKTEYWSRIHHE